ncbi:hypothetical protein BDV33DRAFT_184524 [Aspergillus novoparasiticus]|uniref:C2H2-type domain-containing protein n=1 Tax=Aspergillus novoparasiticus TaxID=986946 RepID=A0A5N6EAY2_9EURO|nr:hypothetical protein BDV33DRAFT_184524 [Aspergillus novoparasiticus]
MPEMELSPARPYRCTAKLCEGEFETINEWRHHVNGYCFQEGHICLYNNCTEFIPASSNESLTHRSHLYLRHNIEPASTEKMKDEYIKKNYCSVERGQIWCSECREVLKLDNRGHAFEHIEGHVLCGITIKVPGQTTLLPEISGTMDERAPRLVEDDGLDLSQRGVIVWVSPAEDTSG